MSWNQFLSTMNGNLLKIFKSTVGDFSMKNITEVTVFILTGLTDSPDLQTILFCLFLTIYLFTLVGNIGLIVLVIEDSQLHNPMYYFLSVLSSVDACYSSDIVPKMLAAGVSMYHGTILFMYVRPSSSYALEHDMVVSIFYTIIIPMLNPVIYSLRNKDVKRAMKKVFRKTVCKAQRCFAVTFGTTECFVLAAMAYDPYVAIYNPLLYSVSMTPRIYVLLITASYLGGILHATVDMGGTFSLSFCGPNIIQHIFCDIPALFAISCSDTHRNQLLLFYIAGSVKVFTVLVVLVSYGFILSAILRTRSAEGKRKVFSTCGSHLTAVSICHGTLIFMYVRPSSSYTLEHDMMVSICYTILIPLLNPIIYSLRNKDVKQAM
ncbi:Olfactory receptor 5T2 [Heterocephalus glaber]|uniref:Olfactory receptor 5T2 n=1 Tax=Heterocephalus glaber TaxID=10181 RepID=G5BG45_HETGA|nr:Olfactory receptor 5T2 [Heterocephalus glaber]